MNKFNPKVSIIIPVYNGSNYLKEAIDSALNQTYDNIEVLVINDGSNDNGETEKIALSYGDKIRYFKKENGGVATALNLGLEKMTGEYFSWLSHDDVYYPEKIEKQIQFLSQLKNKDVILYSNYSFINENSEPYLNPVIHNHEMLKEKPLYALYRGCVNGITLLIPKKCFDKCGKFDPQLRCTQDYDMWLRMIKKYDFIHMEDVLAKTRIHSEQDTQKNPRAVSEGNALWTKMVEEITDEEKEKLEGTVYNFYKEMYMFLLPIPYDKAAEYCKKKCENVEKKIKKNISDIRVSVIIPFYNRIKEVFVATNSVLNQTHQNVEIILVNDGSTESLDHLISKYEKNPKVKLISLKNNNGPSKARNAGIKEATGEFIAFLDSDDYFEPYKIETQLLQMVLTNSIISHTSYLRRDIENPMVDVIHTGSITGKVIPQLIYSCPIATPTVMIKRQFLIENNLYFKEDIKYGEDICFWLSILKNNDLLGIDDPLTVVNVNSNSTGYNIEKQMEGLKNILTFVLQDEEFKKENYAIAKLCDLIKDVYLGNESNGVSVSNHECQNYNEINESNGVSVSNHECQNYNEINESNGISVSNHKCQNCNEINEILNSTSWRVTRSLRFVSKWIKTLGHETLNIIQKIKKNKENNPVNLMNNNQTQ